MTRPSLLASVTLLLGSMAMIGIFADVIAGTAPVALIAHGRLYVLPALTAPDIVDPLGLHAAGVTWSLQPWIRPSTEGLAVAASPDLATAVTWWVYGCRHWLLVIAPTCAISVGVGVPLGVLAALGPAMVDSLLARFTDASGMLPTVVMLALGQAVLPGWSGSAFVLVVGFWQGVALARVLKQRVLQTAIEPVVQGARGLGVPAVRRLMRHIAPEVATTLGPSLALTAGSVASLDAALAFMQLGPVTDYPSWGSVLAAQAASGHLGLASGPALLGFSLSVGGLYWLGLSIGTRFGTGWGYELFKARLRS